LILSFRKVYDKRTQTYRLKKVWPLAIDLAVTFLIAIVLAWLLNVFVVGSFWISSGSMRATLLEQDQIWAEKVSPYVWGVENGEVIVFRDPGGWSNAGNSEPLSEFIVKRVIGVGGDRVSCQGAGEPVVVNGVELDEPYIYQGENPSDVPFDVEVPEGMLWVMGDNRANSSDSRFFSAAAYGGFIPLEYVVGQAIFRFAPWDRFGLLPDYRAVFAALR
jgi:signal peptidase I